MKPTVEQVYRFLVPVVWFMFGVLVGSIATMVRVVQVFIE